MYDAFAIAVIVFYTIDIAFLFIFGFHCYAMVALYRNGRRRCVSGLALDLSENPSALPVVTIQLPIFNEYYVVDRLLEFTTAIRWPRKKLEIQVLDDSTDETRDRVAELVRDYRQAGFNIEHLHRTVRTGHKAGALREGLAIARGDFIAIFDADFTPPEDFLIRTMPHFKEPDIGMVQTRWGHINADYSMLTRAQSIGIDGHFVLEQVARNGNDLWMNFNGTGGVWRKACIVEAGNWQSDTLTEDFDLSYRAEMAGWSFRYLNDVVSPAEIPATIAAYKSQQFRWCKGSLQTAVKLLPRIWKSDANWKIKTEACIHLLNYSVHPLMVLNIMLLLPLLLVHEWTIMPAHDYSIEALVLISFLLGVATFGPTVFYTYSQRELYPGSWKKKMIWLPVLMMVGTGIALVNTRAYFEAIFGVKSGFKRTPKLRIESKIDRIQERKLYRLPLDALAFAEVAVGIYCLVCIAYSIYIERYVLLPFLTIYASGFLYIGLGSIFEARQNSQARRKGPRVEKAEYLRSAA